MDIGMLWFDNDPKSDLNTKVNKAAAYYKNKYGEDPNLCFVHPSMLPATKSDTGNITVCSNASIIPNHLWIGVETQQAPVRFLV